MTDVRRRSVAGRPALAAAALATLLASTASAQITSQSITIGGERDALPAQGDLVADAVPRVVDPKLDGGAPTFAFHLEPGGSSLSAVAELRSGGTPIVTLWSGTLVPGAPPTQVVWDGRDALGERCDTGAYTLHVAATGQPPLELPVDVVRLGVSEIEAQESAAGNDEWQMVYFKKGGLYDYFATPEIHEYLCVADGIEGSDLDLNDAEPRPVPAVHDATDTAVMEGANYEDDAYNYPLAYLRGASPRLELTFGATATSAEGSVMGAGYPVAGYDLRAVVQPSGGSAVATGPITPGGTATVDLDPLPDELGRTDLELEVSWQVAPEGTSQWSDVPGATTIPLRVYTLLAEPNFAAGTSGTRYGPWVEVAEYLCTWKAVLGLPSGDEQEVTALHVKGFFGQNGGLTEAIEGVLYDCGPLGGDGGATHYFSFGNWRMDLTSLFDGHANGIYVNCSDNMGATTTMLAMMGVDGMRPVRLGNMSLRAIWGIGAPGYTTNLWGGGNHSFSYHHIVTNDDAVTVSDTCMQLDEDGNADSTPGVPGWNHHRTWAGVGGYNDLSSSNNTARTLEALPKIQ